MADDYPKAITFADLQVGMRFHMVGDYGNGDRIEQVATVTGKGTSTASTSTGYDAQPENTWTPTPTAVLTYEQVEPYTGDPNEPAIGSLIRSGDGTCYQRLIPDGSDRSAWYQPGSSTASEWADIIATTSVVVVQNGASS